MGSKRRQRAIEWRKKNRDPIAFGMCLEKYVPQQFWPCFHNMEKRPRDEWLTIAQVRTDRARNWIVEKFLETKATHLLFLDSDQVFPPETVERLLSHKKLVVGCLYFHRQPPYQPHAYRWSETGKMRTGEPMIEAIEVTAEDQGLIQVDAIGTGGLMVARRVYADIIEPPWFEYGGQEESEDVTFCRKLEKVGVPVFVDCGCESGHLTEFIVGRENYLFNRERGQT
jgi:hypothetical protein